MKNKSSLVLVMIISVMCILIVFNGCSTEKVSKIFKGSSANFECNINYQEGSIIDIDIKAKSKKIKNPVHFSLEYNNFKTGGMIPFNSKTNSYFVRIENLNNKINLNTEVPKITIKSGVITDSIVFN